METTMMKSTARLCSALALAATLITAVPVTAGDGGDGVVRVQSTYPMAETITRVKQDLAAKGIMFFTEIDQAKLAAGAGITLRPSTLLIFGNPPLGVQFLTANPDSGLDWPVRLLVREDEQGRVWTVYSDFAWIAARYGITNREAQFRMASQVIASITAAAK
jgi:uncharacterized protein (DUF302 family)